MEDVEDKDVRLKRLAQADCVLERMLSTVREICWHQNSL
jgi:hypothetical protein